MQRKKSIHISVITPVYNCNASICTLYKRLKESLEKINPDFEIIMVNDASPDGAWETIKEIAGKDKRVKGINLSRNFGQHYAITAGLEHCRGEWVVVMDCDMQDQPEEIIKLYNKALEGFDIVLAKRINRQDGFFKRKFSHLFYKLLGYLTETEQDSSIANFGIYSKNCIQAVISMKDNLRYFPAMVRWVGFNVETIDIVHSERFFGKSSYNLNKLLKLGIDVIISFSDKPLRITIKTGLAISVISLILAIYFLIKYFLGKVEIMGWISTIISIWLLAGIIIIILGIVGLYLGKTFEKVKNRPNYIIKEILNGE